MCLSFVDPLFLAGSSCHWLFITLFVFIGPNKKQIFRIEVNYTKILWWEPVTKFHLLETKISVRVLYAK